jgi:hypothetical protein
MGWITDQYNKIPSWGKAALGNPLEQWEKDTAEGGILGDPVGTAARQEQGALASQFGTERQGEFSRLGGDVDAQRRQMERYARGQDSLSAIQLQQSLQQNVANQQGMAASARPGQGAMAARNAAMNANRAGAGLAGQQAIAGIQERQGAQNALNQMLMQQREQELKAGLGGREQAISAYSPQGSSGGDRQAGMVSGLLQAFA